jgi:hypothetical protein
MQKGFVVLVAGAAVAVVWACSGKTSDSTGDAGSSGASIDGASGGSSGGLSPACPATAPSLGAACSTLGLDCEYGADPNVSCRAIFECAASGWVAPTLNRGGSTVCPTPPQPAACPASLGAASGTCTTAGTRCIFPEGAACTCEVYCGSQYPVGHECDAGTPTTWVCGGASAGCPAQRPRYGSTCGQEGQTCSYSEPNDCTTPDLVCTSGTWRVQSVGCALSSRGMKRDIAYLGDDERQALAARTLATRLATYRYKGSDPSQHLGFIVEDDPSSPAVAATKDRVDLYAYTSMAVATLQEQARELTELRAEVAELRRDVSRATAACATTKPAPRALPR